MPIENVKLLNTELHTQRTVTLGFCHLRYHHHYHHCKNGSKPIRRLFPHNN